MYTHATDAGWISRSHQAIAPFRLVRPASIEEALEAGAEENASFIAGGIDLVRRMRGGDRWQTLIDISGLSEMKVTSDEGDYLRIGALTSHWEIETGELIRKRLPNLQAAWRTIGNVRIRMTGTLGGNILAREAGYDGLVLLGVMGAELVFVTSSGEAVVIAGTGAPLPDSPALLTSVRIPISADTGLAFDRSLKPVVSVAVCKSGDTATVGVGCAFNSPRYSTIRQGEDAQSISSHFPDAIDNPMGGAAYRSRMVGVLAARMLAGGNGL